MNILICKRCKTETPEDEISLKGWCLRCKHKYSSRLAALGNKNKKMPPDTTSVVPRTGIDEIVRLAKLSGQLKTQARATNNNYKWKQYFDNEAALKKEVDKWRPPPPTFKT